MQVEGSPPRMRGKPNTGCNSKIYFGITPADAGKTSTAASRERMRQDHPRGCGENLVAADKRTLDVGSPPRMRGKRSVTDTRYTVRRITPADAGKTNRSIKQAESVRDHPRGCGENFINIL